MTRSAALLSVLLVMVMATTAGAVAIPNSSFETGANDNWTTSISGWTLVPPISVPPSNYRAGLFFDYDGFTATHKDAFAILTHRNLGGQSVVSSSVFLQSWDNTLTFDYVYVTKNPPGSTVQIDPFTVTLWDSSNTELESWTVSDTDDSNLAAGSITSIPFAPGGDLQNTYDTGWQTFTVDIRDYVGQTVYLEFHIADTAQGGGGSGFFLDQVSIAPEPGTFALFGVGAIGLMLFGRRKMRRKK